MKIRRGDIYWIEQSKYRPTVGSMQTPGRPGIVVSNDANNNCSLTFEIVYLTGKPKKDLPTHCTIKSSVKPSIALCEQVTTVSDEQIREYVGTCTPEEMKEVDRCIAISLGLTAQDKPVTDSPFFSAEEVNEMAVAITRAERDLAVANARADLLQEMYDRLLQSTIR